MEKLCNGVPIAHELTGQGPAVTFVHGLSADRRVWRDLAEPLSRAHRVLTYDLRGHGESGRPPAGDYSYDAHVQDLLALLDGLEIEQTALVAWSMGASIAMAFAAKYPERVSRLVLISSTPVLVARPDFPHAPPIGNVLALAAYAHHDFDGLVNLLSPLLLPEPHHPELDDLVQQMARQAGREVHTGVLLQTAHEDLRPMLSRITAPTLAVHGELDAVCYPDAGRYVADCIPGAAFCLIELAGHAPFLTKQEVVQSHLERFLSDSTSPSGK